MTLKRALFALLLLILVGLIAVWGLLRASLPATGHQTLPGITDPTFIHYDQWQRPHVSATNLHNALRAEGWLHASHRLWQMELLRRAGSGRMAALLGQELIETDKLLWRFGVPQLAQRLKDNASGKTLAAIDAYLQGVNAAVTAYSLPPPEFLLLQHTPTAWTVEDVFAVGALLAFESANNADNELLRLALANTLPSNRLGLFFEDLSDQPDFPFIFPDEVQNAASNALPGPHHSKANAAPDSLAAALDPLDHARQPLMPRLSFGSNGWVVGAARSQTGHALFAFDSHDRLGLPNLFYEVHLVFDAGSIHGWSVPGLPGVINGYNDTIAWGFTNIGDSQDLFIETRGAEAHSFIEDGETYTAQTESLRLNVRGDSPVTFEVVHTRNGPLIHEEPPISVAWTVHAERKPSLDALLELNLAQSWQAFNESADRHLAPVLNATFADNAGNIGFRTVGRLPQRAQGTGLTPLPASAANRWRGLVEPGQMPRLYNPPAGFIAAANARIAPSGSVPLVSADNAAAYRMRRLHDALNGSTKLGAEQMQVLQRDWLDPQASLLLPDMLAELEGSNALSAERRILEVWLDSPIAAPNSAAALLFQQWYLHLAKAIFEPALDADLYERLLGRSYMLNAALDTLLRTDRHRGWWPAPRPQVLADSLAAAARSLKESLGQRNSWRLDRLQSVRLEHELSRAVPALSWLLARGPQPWGGSPATVGRASYSYRKPFQVSKAATVRSVGVMRADPVFSAVMPGGQSGHPLSQHYDDQFSHWLAGELLLIEPPETRPADVSFLPTSWPETQPEPAQPQTP